MSKISVLVAMVALAALGGCAALARSWPDRANKSPGQMLADVIRWQQQVEVRASTGEWAVECFTDDDFAAFVRTKRPEVVVERLKKSADFREIASALRTLPAIQRAAAFKEARSIAHPTWAMMGWIDPTGRGQTEAGRRAELMIAAAIVEVFEAATAPPS